MLKIRDAIKYSDTDTIVPDFKNILLRQFSETRRYAKVINAAISDTNINIRAQIFIVVNSIFNKKKAVNVNITIIAKIKIIGIRFLIIILTFLGLLTAI